MNEEKKLIEDLNKAGIHISSISDLSKKPSTERDLIEDLKKVGINISSVWELASGFPNYEKAEPILRKHYLTAEKIQIREGIVCAIRSIETELIEDLKNVGVEVSSVWDLVNGPNNYNQAESVLIKHLKATKECRFKEGIVRSLSVKSFKNAVRPLLDEFKNSKDESYKWAVGNTLSIIASKESLNELIQIMDDHRHGRSRQMIAEALGRIGDKKSVPVLLRALEDDDIAGHAIEALGKLADDETVIEIIKPFLKHKMKWKRKAAQTSINRIKKRLSKKLVR